MWYQLWKTVVYISLLLFFGTVLFLLYTMTSWQKPPTTLWTDIDRKWLTLCAIELYQVLQQQQVTPYLVGGALADFMAATTTTTTSELSLAEKSLPTQGQVTWLVPNSVRKYIHRTFITEKHPYLRCITYGTYDVIVPHVVSEYMSTTYPWLQSPGWPALHLLYAVQQEELPATCTWREPQLLFPDVTRTCESYLLPYLDQFPKEAQMKPIPWLHEQLRVYLPEEPLVFQRQVYGAAYVDTKDKPLLLKHPKTQQWYPISVFYYVQKVGWHH